MIAEKEKKTARANTPRRPVRCPQKTGINLNLHEKRSPVIRAAVIAGVFLGRSHGYHREVVTRVDFVQHKFFRLKLLAFGKIALGTS